MLNFLEKFKEKQKLKKILLAFYQEIEKNWELWHVMDQRNVLDVFQLSCWQEVKNHPGISFDDRISQYVGIFEDYNAAMNDFKKYEEWYASDVDNKTPDNAKVLHSKKNVLQEKFKGMLKVVESARDSLGRQLVDKKIFQDR